MDPLVLGDHPEGPDHVRRVRRRVVRERRVERRVLADRLQHEIARRLAVVADFDERRPLGLGRREVVPRHLVDARLEQDVELVVEARRQRARHAQLVDRERRGVAVVEDLRVSEAVRRWAVVRVRGSQRREQDLRQRPAVLEVRLEGPSERRAAFSQVRRAQRREAFARRIVARTLLRREARPEARRVQVVGALRGARLGERRELASRRREA
mmetsp:Transcript_2310/g.6834  ORF Transcript_2310/g.6834 Transcript_2310/m.6834 type:complete len:212 (-) Transcript_2310:208-843(-)